jgi:hypothetical protein
MFNRPGSLAAASPPRPVTDFAKSKMPALSVKNCRFSGKNRLNRVRLTTS